MHDANCPWYLFLIVEIWWQKDSFESNKTPRYLTYSFCSIAFLFISRVIFIHGLFGGEKIVKLVLETFKASLFAISHSLNSLRPVFITSCILSRLFASKYIFVSSANRKNSNWLEIFGRSLIYNKNNSGPSTDPWATQQVICLCQSLCC